MRLAGAPYQDYSCDSGNRQAKASSLILARRSDSLRGTCLVQTTCLSQVQLKPFGWLTLPAFVPTVCNVMNNMG